MEKPGGVERHARGDLRSGLWLAVEDVRKSWVSFPVAALTTLIPSFFLVGFYSDVFGDSVDRSGVFILDFWFLLMVTILNVNFLFNRDYYYRPSEDNYTKRLSFLIRLPITPRVVIAGRAMYMTLALAFNAPSFFLLPYLVSGDLRSEIGSLDYVWFVFIWIGYAMFMMGFLLFMWNGLNFETEQLLLFLFFPGGCLVVATISNLALDGGLTMTLIQAAETQGPLAAVASVVVGGSALILWTKLAESRLGRRELG